MSKEYKTTVVERAALQIGAAALVLLVGSCAGVKEAYETRVCWSGTTPIHCSTAVIEFGCPRDLTTLVRASESTGKHVTIRVDRASESTQVGWLFHQTEPDIPIFVEDESPWDTLHADLTSALALAGYGPADDSKMVLEIYAVTLDVRSEPPGWLDLRMTTRAEVSFAATLRADLDDVRWSRRFSGSGQIAHAYAALGDYEAVLGSAYCEALGEFARAIETEVFGQGWIAPQRQLR